MYAQREAYTDTELLDDSLFHSATSFEDSKSTITQTQVEQNMVHIDKGVLVYEKTVQDEELE